MNKLHLTTQFKKDVKKAKRRGKDTTKLQEIIEKIATGTPRDPRHKPPFGRTMGTVMGVSCRA